MPQQRSKQSGYVLVFTVIVLGAFLSFAAIALDIGQIYLWKLRLDKSARAGVLSGLGYRSLRGWQTIYGGPPEYTGGVAVAKTADQSSEMREMLRVTHNVVLDNFRASFAPGSEPVSNTSAETPMQFIRPLDNDGDVITELPNDAYNPVDDSLTVRYAYDVPTFLIGRISNVLGFTLTCDQGGGSRCRVTTTQTASLDYANIILLLDVSGSMNCEEADPDCSCRLTNSCEEGSRIIDVLRPYPSSPSGRQFALTEFYRLFNPFRDRMAIIPFNLAAQLRFSTVGADGKPRAFGDDDVIWDDFTTAVTNLDAASNTNPCDAFIHAIGELQALYGALSNSATAPVPQAPLTSENEVKPFVVLFSDGAPNAFRGRFLNAVMPPDQDNDWYQFGLEWASAGPPPSVWSGPSPLVNASGGSLFNYAPAVLPGSSSLQLPPGNTNLPCGGAWYSGFSPGEAALPFYGHTLNWHLPSYPVNPRGCLRDPDPNPGTNPGLSSALNFEIPGTAPGVAGVTGVRLLTGRNRVGFEILGTEELPYYCTVEAADYIRRTFGGTVYTIGLGNGGNSQCNDPLQDSGNSFVRKDNFLSRVAFDPSTVGANAFLDQFSFSRRTITPNAACANPAGAVPIEVGYTPVTGADRTPAELGDTNGRYYATNNPADLPALFAQVAKQILLRLNS